MPVPVPDCTKGDSKLRFDPTLLLLIAIKGLEKTELPRSLGSLYDFQTLGKEQLDLELVHTYIYIYLYICISQSLDLVSLLLALLPCLIYHLLIHGLSAHRFCLIC